MSNTARQSTAATHHADAQWRVRPADGLDDAFFLMRQWHHWFGGAYEWPDSLQLDLFPIVDWTYPDDAHDEPPIDAHGVIAEHIQDDHSVAVGGGLVVLIDTDQTADELPPGRYDPQALVGDENACFMLNAVDAAWRGRGIGSALLEARLEWATSTDAEMGFACGWERREGPASRGLLEDTGFIAVQRIEGMYADSGRPACPDCGIWPSDDRTCQCDATVWAKDL